ncbi:uncharacterized protein J7T54_000758 [Emericellopsis cladophorae]|uniref:Rhodopsin domain-containing protein n=1 Tax=Emericellopsis cladophorae TaxID=2686198 RepID=A0A9P9XWN8_9HYPO|nr:uncharacterized protein J7T54_000758 [Emericellopsis cladophorae]KAI6778724.1 hypothetical protein J7T54_000758 [Emericellopsis cladophorae]
MAESWTYNTPPGTPSDGPMIAGLASAFTAFSLVVLLLRIYVRTVFVKAMGAETKWGLGLLELDHLPDENIYFFGFWQFVGAPFYIISILFFKLSLLLTYLRVVPAGVYSWTIVTVIGLCFAYHVCFLIVQINLCTPLAFQWDRSLSGTCVETVPFYLSMASLTIIFDIVVMLLPVPVLLKAQIQLRKKLVLLTLLGLGIFITVIQIFRIQTVVRLANYLDSAPLIMWSTVENNLGVIVVCVPTLAPLIKYFDGKVRSSRDKSNFTGRKYATGSRNHQSSSFSEQQYQQASYSLHNWGGKTNGITTLGRGVDHHVSGDKDDTASTECILEGSGGIVKRVEMTITESKISQSDRDSDDLAR